MTKTGPTNLLSSAPGPGTNALHDIRPPVTIPTGWAWVLWVGAALVVLGLLWLLWRYIRKRRSTVVPAPVIPPHIRAKQKLEEALRLLSEPREFCIVVSDTVRWYLEERFEFRAPERTTEEFLHELQATNLLTAAQKESLGDFLQRCDLVKFARYEPTVAELRNLHSSALRLVDETEPRPVVAGANVQLPAEAPAPVTEARREEVNSTTDKH